ncbi:uncharacterized protein LOC127126099 isoform X2 [Lathyrus oleraceus]|uniref:uncharacterized protein LOC127126099 isoform X2 n=2 Tax=Pisum sativum TaxID=3888 RepID=UPI0021CDF33E|nr:uncharacterized protein LOC127126099 isoform X2 [Pisum sativum]
MNAPSHIIIFLNSSSQVSRILLSGSYSLCFIFSLVHTLSVSSSKMNNPAEVEILLKDLSFQQGEIDKKIKKLESKINSYDRKMKRTEDKMPDLFKVAEENHQQDEGVQDVGEMAPNQAHNDVGEMAPNQALNDVRAQDIGEMAPNQAHVGAQDDGFAKLMAAKLLLKIPDDAWMEQSEQEKDVGYANFDELDPSELYGKRYEKEKKVGYGRKGYKYLYEKARQADNDAGAQDDDFGEALAALLKIPNDGWMEQGEQEKDAAYTELDDLDPSELYGKRYENEKDDGYGCEGYRYLDQNARVQIAKKGLGENAEIVIGAKVVAQVPDDQPLETTAPVPGNQFNTQVLYSEIYDEMDQCGDNFSLENFVDSNVNSSETEHGMLENGKQEIAKIMKKKKLAQEILQVLYPQQLRISQEIEKLTKDN